MAVSEVIVLEFHGASWLPKQQRSRYPARLLQPSKFSPNIRTGEGPSNARGIPTAPFVDNVEDYVSSRAEVEGVLKNFQEMIE
jgi:hypothetical protein